MYNGQETWPSNRNKWWRYNINPVGKWLNKYILRKIKSTMSSTATKLSSTDLLVKETWTNLSHFQFNSGPHLPSQSHFASFLWIWSHHSSKKPCYFLPGSCLCWNCSKLVFYILNYAKIYSFPGLISNAIFSWKLLFISPPVTIPFCSSTDFSLYEYCV